MLIMHSKVIIYYGRGSTNSKVPYQNLGKNFCLLKIWQKMHHSYALGMLVKAEALIFITMSTNIEWNLTGQLCT